MRLKHIAYLFAAAAMLVSCESELEVTQISSITGSNYWQNSNDVEGYLIGLYSNYRSLTNSLAYGETRGDAMKIGFRSGVSAAFTHNLTAEQGSNWRGFYANIHHCNMIIKYAPGIAFGNAADKNRILAQAYTLRARDYLTLLQTWGDVPVVLLPTETNDKSNKPARQPKTVVMQQILKDIETALGLYPEATIPDKYHVSRPAALMLKAEALAWNYTVLKSNDRQNLTDGIAALEEVEKCGVSLMNDYAQIFDVDHRKNSEIIFSIHVQFGEYDNMYATNLSVNEGTGLIKQIVNVDDIVYSKGNVAEPHYAPSDELRALYAPGDVRAKVAYLDGVDAAGKIKFTVENKFRGTAYAKDHYWDNDIVVYRLADAYLLKAELLCYLGGDNVRKAIDAMLPVRTRAGIGAYTGPADQEWVQREILDERGRELCFELKRWPDIMRANGAGTIDVYKFVPNLVGKSTPLYLPILRTMMDLNENLVQTEGY